MTMLLVLECLSDSPLRDATSTLRRIQTMLVTISTRMSATLTKKQNEHYKSERGWFRPLPFLYKLIKYIEE